MVLSLTKSIIYFGVLGPGVAAWSPAGTSSDRRGFLQNARKAAVVIGTATLGTAGGGVLVESVEAAATSGSTIYQPPQGSLSGQVHVITGASSGLGLESAKRLAAAGATVVMTTRTDAKGETAKSQVQSYLQERSITNRNVYALTLDMDDLADIKLFPERLSKELGSSKIDVLMNNAGMLTKTREITKDGLEKTFQSNHLGPFLLTSELFPMLDRNGARIVNVASEAHNFAKVVETDKQGLDMSNLNGELSYGLDGWEAYGNTKLENMLFTQELQRRADAAGMTWLTVVSLHPGVVGTDLFRDTPWGKSDTAGKMSLQSISSGIFYNNVWSTEEGANTQIKLASISNDQISKGKYYNQYGKVVALPSWAQDEMEAGELWKVSERLSSCKFDVV